MRIVFIGCVRFSREFLEAVRAPAWLRGAASGYDAAEAFMPFKETVR